MNPVFWLLVLIVLAILWFLISFIFIPLGQIVWKKWENILEILNKTDEQILKEKETEKDE